MQHDDISAAFALIAPGNGRRADLRWLTNSHTAPASFFAALHAVAGKTSEPGPTSSLGQRYDLYHDLVVRQVGTGRAAIRVYDERAPVERRWQTLSFDQLHARCTLRAAWWASQGIGPGAALCVALPWGIECVVSLLTGLRLGACVSLVEPQGPDYLAARIAALAPEYLATEPYYEVRLGDHGAQLLALDGPAARPFAGSHAYLTGEACCALLSPLRRGPPEPVPLSCDAAYLGALRDGAVSLALRPGDELAAPGFHTLQHQPALLFAALIMGATFVHISEAALVADLTLLDGFSLRSVGVTAAVRDALVARPPGQRPRWAHVFKNPDEPTDWEAWREFVELLDLRDTPMSNVLIEAASGGSLLVSPRRPGHAWLAELMNVSPAAGLEWALLDFTGSGQLAVADVGVFARASDGQPVEPVYIAMGRRRGAEYLHGGTIEPRRCGRVYPSDEVLATLADCPFLQAASVVAVTAGGPTVAHRFVLLGFTGDEAAERFAELKPLRVAELTRVLETRLAPEFLPDHIELFPCYARTEAGLVDHDWCQAQYLSGTLFRKIKSPVFARLTALRHALESSPAPA
ncbi:AMP-binding protein [Enhygromyxa salina]|uniref:Acyl-CoA synthetase n=1 Tax=Enhygromyxa salina TaxID=215803 RepID=A0A2S9YU95_9BACT|nr:AMP-binding protein [Enhygromyxa salina]PRQ08666.1 acyl-CoA synthetase [Enhygromyxa salina]